MMVGKPLIIAGMLALLAGTARAADITTSYGVPGAPPSQRAPIVVTLCPSSDGSNTVVACASGAGGSVTITGPLPTGSNAIGSVAVTGSLPGGTATLGTVHILTPALTPVAGLAFAVATGGTAVTVFSAGSIVNQAYIVNPIGATESLFVDPVTTAGTTAPGTTGTTTELAAGQSYTIGPTTKAVSVNAVTSGHSFTAVRE